MHDDLIRMTFLQPSPPPFDLQEWKAKPYLARLKANCQDWAVAGFGTPGVVYLLYFITLALFLFRRFLGDLECRHPGVR